MVVTKTNVLEVWICRPYGADTRVVLSYTNGIFSEKALAIMSWLVAHSKRAVDA